MESPTSATSLCLRLLLQDGTTLSFSSSITTALVSIVVYLLGSAIYSLTLHPLAGFPGPVLTSVSRIPWWVSCITGDQVTWIQHLHATYGPVVRFSPNDLSFVDLQNGEVWKEIHGHEKSHGSQEYPKAKEWFLTPHNGVSSLVSADYEDHRRVRRLFSPAFSDRALKSQEALFQKHVSLLVSTISNKIATGGSVINMAHMYNLTTFDIMGDLTFGQPLGMLESAEYSPWVECVFQSVKIIPFVQLIQYYPLLNTLFNWLEPKWVTEMKNNHFDYSSERVDRRLEKGSEQPDIWNLVMAAQGSGQGLSLKEMHSSAEFLMLAGSETTATLLSGLTFFLITNPDKLQRLTHEIRNDFTSESDICMESLAGMKYLNACIQEALRLYPPAPNGVPRVVPAGGRTILERHIPAETRVSIHHYSTYHHPANFTNPDTFVPERWLGNDRLYESDKRKALQPFSTGARNCLGQNMALHEMRLTLAHVLFRFDVEICRETNPNWVKEQKVYALWEKKPMMCRVKEAAA
ncbi:cytochrome P450 [Diplogelasinospora grovesii]|uniref:Cytochrome P450 n=1 Tax=Diplogelasinospora grovesii TaxID=303347 RepID=A0AAN6S0U2_9PEZI|nr:cytochrome P450 [Diplogelasinospora grovesii]